MKYVIFFLGVFLSFPFMVLGHAGEDEFAHHGMMDWGNGMMGWDGGA